MTQQAPAFMRFWGGVDKDGPLHPVLRTKCWIWTRYKDKLGYGKFRWNGQQGLVHRYSYLLHYKELPDNLLVLHHCDNPSCVNPEHLFLGTNQDNVDDRESKCRNIVPYGEWNGNSKLTNEKIENIRFLSDAGLSYRQIAAIHNVTNALIGCIVRREIWKHVSE